MQCIYNVWNRDVGDYFAIVAIKMVIFKKDAKRLYKFILELFGCTFSLIKVMVIKEVKIS